MWGFQSVIDCAIRDRSFTLKSRQRHFEMKRIGLLLFPVALIALPSGNEVVSGKVHFSAESEQTLVVTASDRAIINFQNFDIALGEKVQFIQPNSSATVLNRV